MIEPRPSVTRFVRAVARAEGGTDDGAGADVAGRIMAELHRSLGKLIGPLAFDVLLRRALALAKRAHPDLEGVTSGSGGLLSGLDASAHRGSGAHEGALSIVSHFVELLVVLIGEDLAMRLVRDVWPAVLEEETR